MEDRVREGDRVVLGEREGEGEGRRGEGVRVPPPPSPPAILGEGVEE